jgi:hypothetical protein
MGIVELFTNWRVQTLHAGGSDVPESGRQRAFGINTSCFVKIGGCKRAEEILSAVWQMALTA